LFANETTFSFPGNVTYIFLDITNSQHNLVTNLYKLAAGVASIKVQSEII